MKHFSLPKDGGLIEKGLPKDILHGRERIYTEIGETPFSVSQVMCDRILGIVADFQRKNPGKLFRLGLSSGNSPQPLFKDLREAYAEGRISFKDIAVYSIDE